LPSTPASYRAAIRSYILEGHAPDSVLRQIDRTSAHLVGGLLATCCVVRFRRHADRWSLEIANAGHPPPLVRRGTPGQPGTARYVEVPPGAPLGLGGPRGAVTVDFPPGDTLLLFSDGLVERRQRSLTDGFDRLAVALAGATTGDPRTLGALATGAVPGSTEDDVAVLAVEHATSPSRSAGMEVPAEPTAPGRVRHWLHAQLTLWAVPEQVIGSAVLCASELTTNALLHAGTAARVEIDLSPERLLVSVADSGTRGSVTRARTEKLSSRGRGLGLIEELSDAWGTDPTVRGSTVWFEILIPPGEPAGTVPG